MGNCCDGADYLKAGIFGRKGKNWLFQHSCGLLYFNLDMAIQIEAFFFTEFCSFVLGIVCVMLIIGDYW
jgi:hypothetical protein